MGTIFANHMIGERNAAIESGMETLNNSHSGFHSSEVGADDFTMFSHTCRYRTLQLFHLSRM